MNSKHTFDPHALVNPLNQINQFAQFQISGYMLLKIDLYYP